MKNAMEGMNTDDGRKDVIIIISDGFFGDLENVQTASAQCCARGITTLSIAYESNNAILVSSYKNKLAKNGVRKLSAITRRLSVQLYRYDF